MGRWSHLDTDQERLPDGFVRIGYDADLKTYTFRDASTGEYYESAPGARYGTLYPVVSAAAITSTLQQQQQCRHDESETPNQAMVIGRRENQRVFSIQEEFQDGKGRQQQKQEVQHAGGLRRAGTLSRIARFIRWAGGGAGASHAITTATAANSTTQEIGLKSARRHSSATRRSGGSGSLSAFPRRSQTVRSPPPRYEDIVVGSGRRNRGVGGGVDGGNGGTGGRRRATTFDEILKPIGKA